MFNLSQVEETLEFTFHFPTQVFLPNGYWAASRSFFSSVLVQKSIFLIHDLDFEIA